MSAVQIEQNRYEMPPPEGISIAHFLTVTDIQRSARYYEKVFGARILSLGDGNAPAYLQLANIWMILNVGGGSTPDKPTQIFKRAINYGKVEGPNSSPGRSLSTARHAATSAILTVISSRSDRAPIKSTVNAWHVMDTRIKRVFHPFAPFAKGWAARTSTFHGKSHTVFQSGQKIRRTP
jgi:hypothetical protein